MSNQLPNPGFEVDTAGWLRQDGTSTLTRTTAEFHSGVASVAWSTVSATYMSSTTTAVPATPGRKYAGGVWVKGATLVAAALLFYDAAQVQIGSPTVAPDVAPAAGVWTQLVAPTVVAPAGAAYVRVRLYQRTATAQTIYADDFTLGPVTQLVATPLPELAAVRLELLDAPDGPLLVTRNGAPVRQPAGMAVAAGLAVITDYEPPLTGPLIYATADTDGGTVTTIVAELPAPAGGVVPVLMVATQPAQRVAAPIVGYDENTPSTSTVHQILDSGDPVPVLGPLSTRRGRLTFRCDSYELAESVRQLLAPRSVVQLRHTVPGLDMYVTLGDVAVQLAETVLESGEPARRWLASVDYVETTAAAGDLAAAAGWTWADVADSYGTWADVAAAFSTWHKLAVGP